MNINTNKKGIVLGGYDLVAYHEMIQSPARLGDKKHASVYNESTYYFRNEKNKSLFDANPSLYIPQYGGYCATAMSEGNAVPVDPETFLIIDGKLYLFYHDMLGNNTLLEWNSNIQERQKSADHHWNASDVTYVGKGIVYSSIKTVLKNLFL